MNLIDKERQYETRKNSSSHRHERDGNKVRKLNLSYCTQRLSLAVK